MDIGVNFESLTKLFVLKNHFQPKNNFVSQKGLKTLESPGIRMNPLELQGSLADLSTFLKTVILNVPMNILIMTVVKL